MTEDLDVIDPAGTAVDVAGERLVIRPLVIGVLPELIRTARPVLDTVLEIGDAPDDGELLPMVMDLIEKHGDQVFAAAALCTGREVAWVRGLDLAEFADLAGAVFEVNRDFFVRKLVPLLAARAPGLARKTTTGAGPTPSSS